MQIKRSRKYLAKLFSILEHISKDKVTASQKFKNDLDKKIKDIIYFHNENIRDMIFKEYNKTAE